MRIIRSLVFWSSKEPLETNEHLFAKKASADNELLNVRITYPSYHTSVSIDKLSSCRRLKHKCFVFQSHFHRSDIDSPPITCAFQMFFTGLFTDRVRLRGLSRVQAQDSKTPRVTRQAPPVAGLFFRRGVRRTSSELAGNSRLLPEIGA